MFKTRITELFGVEHPVVQGGLMWIATSELVPAVANAGGMGFLTALTYPTPEELAADIRKTREMSDKPFGVNVTFLPTLKPVDYGEYIDACIDEGIKFMETAGRNPEPYMEKMKNAGMVVTHASSARRSKPQPIDLAPCSARAAARPERGPTASGNRVLEYREKFA